jgi:hypothetical protein
MLASSGVRRSVPAGEDGSCLRPRDHCDQLHLIMGEHNQKSPLNNLPCSCSKLIETYVCFIIKIGLEIMYKM